LTVAKIKELAKGRSRSSSSTPSWPAIAYWKGMIKRGRDSDDLFDLMWTDEAIDFWERAGTRGALRSR